MPVRCPDCPWAGRAPCEEWCCSLPGKTWGEAGAAGAAGSQLRIWGSRLLARSICLRGCRSPVLAAGSKITCRVVDDASGAQRRARVQGRWGWRLQEPLSPSSTYSPEGIPNALGCPHSQGQVGRSPKQHQLLLHRFSSFTEPPPGLGGLFWQAEEREQRCQFPPTRLPLDSTLPSLVFLTWQSKHLRDLLPLKTWQTA